MTQVNGSGWLAKYKFAGSKEGELDAIDFA